MSNEENKKLTPVPIFSLKEVLKDKELKKLFHQHCVKEESIENLLFLQKVINYKELDVTKITQQRKLAKEIFKKFLEEDSLYELNCNKKEVVKIQEILENNDQDQSTFDTLFKQIEGNLKDSLVRFLSSEEYHVHQAKILKKRSYSNCSLKILPLFHEVLLSPETIEDFETPKSSSIDETSNTKVSWRNMLKKFKDVYQYNLSGPSSPELSSIEEPKLRNVRLGSEMSSEKKSTENSDDDWDLNEDEELINL